MTESPVPGAALADSVAALVARLRRAMRRAARARRPSMALSVAQLELLTAVEELGGARTGELAQTLRLASNSVSTLANALVGLGMLDRSAGRSDRRAVEFALTAAGAANVRDWRETGRASLAAAVDALSEEDQQVLTSVTPVLGRLITLLDEQTDATS